MKTGIHPCVDYVFKKLYGSEDIALLLVSLLNAILGLSRPVTGVQIVLPQTDKAFAEDKLAIGDIKARDQGNRQFHLEMQWQVPWFFPNACCSTGAIPPAAVARGRALRHAATDHFDLLHQPDPLSRDRRTPSRLSPARREARGRFCEDMEIHLIESPKFTKTAEQLTTALDRWVYFLRHGGPGPGQSPGQPRRARNPASLEILSMFTKDENEREIYELRLKYQAIMIPRSWSERC